MRFLHGIVSGNVAGTPVGGGCHAALLTAKAHVVAEMRIFVREADLYVVVAAGQGEPTATALARYAIMDDFAAARRPDFELVALLGPTAGDWLGDVGYPPRGLASLPVWSHADVAPEAGTPGGPGAVDRVGGAGTSAAAGAAGATGVLWLARVHQLGVDGYWIGGPAADVERTVAALEKAGVHRLAPDVAEAARIVASEPAWGREITGDYFPMEVGLDDAIDYTKGCFLGQEPIVRIRDRGHVNWRLVRLDLLGEGGSRDPSPGDRLESDNKPKAGKVTSVARLPDGRGVALGLVHVSVPAGHEVGILSADGGRICSATVVG